MEPWDLISNALFDDICVKLNCAFLLSLLFTFMSINLTELPFTGRWISNPCMGVSDFISFLMTPRLALVAI